MSFDIKSYCFVDRSFSLKNGEELTYDFRGIGLFLCKEGSLAIKGENLELNAKMGDLVCIGSRAQICCSQDGNTLGILITGAIADRFSKEMGEMFCTNGTLTPFVSSQVVQLSDNLEGLSENYIANSAFELINYVSSDSRRASIASQIIVEAINLIKENYSSVYGVEELARALGISKSHLVREFDKYTGTTPGKYLSKVRIDAVKQLLVTTSMSLNDIALKTGFSGDNYLCKAFKKATGETPIAYKNRIISSQYLPNQMVLSDDFVDF